MTELFKIIGALNVAAMMLVAILLRYFFSRLRKSEDDLQDLKIAAVTKEDLREILDLKLSPHSIRLKSIENTVNKISRIIPTPPPTV